MHEVAVGWGSAVPLSVCMLHNVAATNLEDNQTVTSRVAMQSSLATPPSCTCNNDAVLRVNVQLQSPRAALRGRVFAGQATVYFRHRYIGAAALRTAESLGNLQSSEFLGLTTASGAGKTYTMSGTAAQPGINTRALGALFAMLEGAQRRPLVEVAMMQFYCEHVFDLLASDSRRRMEVCNLAAGGLARGQERVTGLVWTPVATAEAALVRAGPHRATAC